MTSEASPSRPAGLTRTLLRAGPLLAGTALLMAGNSLTSTLLGIRAGLEGFGTVATGLILSAYYAGFVAGSLLSPRGIHRVGHVRVFSGLASLASASVLIHVVTPSVVSWFLLRAISGLCLAGLFVVVETWMNATTSNTNRGGLLAAYMTVISASMAAGQVLLWLVDPGGYAAFILASVLVSLAVVPVSLTPIAAPEVPEPTPMSLAEVALTAPLAIVTSLCAGLVVGVVVGTMAVYATLTGLSAERTAALVGLPLLLSVAIHLPVGRLSDRMDRRRVIVALGVMGAVASTAALLVSSDSSALLGLVAIAGGVAYPLYSLSNAHLNDYLSSGAVAEAGARIVLINAVGAAVGPLLVAAAMTAAGPGAFFVVVLAAYLVTATYGAWRITRRAPAPEDERSSFVALPHGASTSVATLGPDAAAAMHPVREGGLDSGEVIIGWVDQGQGPAVVTLEPVSVEDADEDRLWWEELAVELVAAGFRVIRIPDGPAGVAVVDDVLAATGISRATVVAAPGLDVADLAAVVAGHPDRITHVMDLGGGDAPTEIPGVSWMTTVTDLSAAAVADQLIDLPRSTFDPYLGAGEEARIEA